MPRRSLVLTALTLLVACTPSDQKLCEHIMDVMQRERAEAEDATLPSDAQMHSYTKKCVTDLEKERDAKDDEYDEFAACIMDATTIEALVLCDAEPEPDAED